MSDRNPFDPPVAPVADIAIPETRAPYDGVPRIAFLVLATFQIVASWLFAGTYLQLVNTGAASVLALLTTVIGTLGLYAGTVFVLRRRERGRYAFLVAAVALGLSVPQWGWSYPWAWLVGFGAILGIFGAFLAWLGRRSE
jgi:hypothetical protein